MIEEIRRWSMGPIWALAHSTSKDGLSTSTERPSSTASASTSDCRALSAPASILACDICRNNLDDDMQTEGAPLTSMCGAPL